MERLAPRGTTRVQEEQVSSEGQSRGHRTVASQPGEGLGGHQVMRQMGP